jgi:hypothetical protein
MEGPEAFAAYLQVLTTLRLRPNVDGGSEKHLPQALPR